MRRRDFVKAIGVLPSTWPLVARAQSERARRIGVIMGFSAEDEVWQAYLATFRGRLAELGWTAGRNLKIDYRFVGDSAELTRAAAGELVALGPDVIFVSTNPVVTAVLRATHTIPIVFTWVSDSVGSGYMANLAHPGGNITGFHNYEPALGGNGWRCSKKLLPRSVASGSCTFRRSQQTLRLSKWLKPLPHPWA